MTDSFVKALDWILLHEQHWDPRRLPEGATDEQQMRCCKALLEIAGVVWCLKKIGSEYALHPLVQRVGSACSSEKVLELAMNRIETVNLFTFPSLVQMEYDPQNVRLAEIVASNALFLLKTSAPLSANKIFDLKFFVEQCPVLGVYEQLKNELERGKHEIVFTNTTLGASERDTMLYTHLIFYIKGFGASKGIILEPSYVSLYNSITYAFELQCAGDNNLDGLLELYLCETLTCTSHSNLILEAKQIAFKRIVDTGLVGWSINQSSDTGFWECYHTTLVALFIRANEKVEWLDLDCTEGPNILFYAAALAEAVRAL